MSQYYDLGTKITYKHETYVVRGYKHGIGGPVALIEPLVPNRSDPILIPLANLKDYPVI